MRLPKSIFNLELQSKPATLGYIYINRSSLTIEFVSNTPPINIETEYLAVPLLLKLPNGGTMRKLKNAKLGTLFLEHFKKVCVKCGVNSATLLNGYITEKNCSTLKKVVIECNNEKDIVVREAVAYLYLNMKTNELKFISKKMTICGNIEDQYDLIPLWTSMYTMKNPSMLKSLMLSEKFKESFSNLCFESGFDYDTLMKCYVSQACKETIKKVCKVEAVQINKAVFDVICYTDTTRLSSSGVSYSSYLVYVRGLAVKTVVRKNRNVDCRDTFMCELVALTKCLSELIRLGKTKESVVIYCDNQSVIDLINNFKIPKSVTTKCLGSLFTKLSKFNNLSVLKIARELNHADTLLHVILKY